MKPQKIFIPDTESDLLKTHPFVTVRENGLKMELFQQERYVFTKEELAAAISDALIEGHNRASEGIDLDGTLSEYLVSEELW